MSQRSSFTTEYIYHDEDYDNLRAYLEEQGAKHKYLCICEPFTYCKNGEPMPIIAGKVGSLGHGQEWFDFMEYIEDFRPKKPIRFVIVAEDPYGPMVQIIDLMPDGRIVMNEVTGNYGDTDMKVENRYDC